MSPTNPVITLRTAPERASAWALECTAVVLTVMLPLPEKARHTAFSRALGRDIVAAACTWSPSRTKRRIRSSGPVAR